MKKKFIYILLICISLYASSPSPVSAQDENTQGRVMGSEASLGVARLIQVDEQDVKDGSLISAAQNSATLSSLPYDGHVIGVVARDAAIVISDTEATDGVPVISTGRVYVLVSSLEGAIEKGDLLTTSTIPGVAVKAIKSGYVIGAALEDYDNSDTQKADKIAVDLDLHYFNSKPTFPGSLTGILKIALIATREGPSAMFKYIVAALVVIGSFVLGFLTFSRTAAKGVEALGRNPAAKSTIHLGIILNVFIVIVIVLSGLTVAFLILRL